MSQNKTKADLQQNLEASERRLDELQSLQGSGWKKRAKRIQLLGWKYVHYHLIRRLSLNLDARVSLFTGDTITLPLNDVDAKYLYLFGTLSPSEMPLVKYILRNMEEEGQVFYDIGANYGFYSHLVHALVPDTELHLFEPQASVVTYLEKNFLETTALVNQVALTDHIGEVDFYEGFTAGVSGKSSLSSKALERRPEYYKKVVVAATTLDEYVSEHTAPTFIKLDVEGGETSVLQGAKQILADYHPVIAMEVWLDREGRAFSEPAVSILLSYGFQSYRITGTGELQPVALDKISNSERKYENLIFKKP